MKENQFGFRQNYSTIDNIFTLFSFFQIIKLKKRKLFCAFIDFEKAFRGQVFPLSDSICTIKVFWYTIIIWDTIFYTIIHINNNIIHFAIGLQTISDEIENNLDIYLKLFILLYADDTALLAETANEIVCSPVIFLFSKKVSTSFKNNEKRKGDSFPLVWLKLFNYR
jgi:hypothetical protein